VLAQSGNVLTPDQVAVRMGWRDGRLTALKAHKRSQACD